MATTPATPRLGPGHAHVWQVDLLRIVPMVGVVATHVLLYTAPPDSLAAGAALNVLHVSREVFFAVSAFVLFLSTDAGRRPVAARAFWWRRYPQIAGPYLAWTLIYWPLSSGVPWPLLPALPELGYDLVHGWFHLYFLLVTMQLYAVFPLLAWLVRRTRGRHWTLLLVAAALQLATTTVLQYAWNGMPGPLQWWFSGAQMELTSYVFYFVAGALAATHLDACLAWLHRHPRQAALGALAACAVAEAWYAANVAGGQSPGAAANVFQPSTLLLTVGVLVGLWMGAERWLGAHPVDGRLWRVVRAAGIASFGFYLAHMVTLLVITEQPVLSWLPTDRLPWVLGSAVRMAIVVTGTLALTLTFQRTPLSRLLTGRPRVKGAGRP